MKRFTTVSAVLLLLSSCGSTTESVDTGYPAGQIFGVVPVHTTDTWRETQVRVVPEEGPVLKVDADDDGTFLLSGLAAGKYHVVVLEETAKGVSRTYQREVELGDFGARVEIHPPEDPATLVVRGGSQTPFFALFLIPETEGDLEGREIWDILSGIEDGLVGDAILMMVGNRGGPFVVPPLPPGEYRAVATGIEYNGKGVVPPGPAQTHVTLSAGVRTVLTIRGELESLDVRVSKFAPRTGR